MEKTKDLRNENDEELRLKLDTLRKEIYESRSQNAESRSQQTHKIGHKKIEIARIMTILRERELMRVS